MIRIRNVFICILVLAISFISEMHSDAATYMDEDEVYRLLYGITKEEMEQANALAEQHYYEELKELQRQEDEGKLIQVVRSKEELLEAVCYQIMEHREEMYYDTDEVTLFYKKDGYRDDIELYYCKNVPLMGGFYMLNYLQDVITYTYQKKYDTEDGRYRIGINLDFKYSKEEFERHMKDMSELAAQLKCDNDYDSVKAVHDYLIENVDYDYDYKHYDDLTGMEDGVMVCQGYTMAAFNLLSNMGIPVRIICGSIVGPDDDFKIHAWNIVCVDGQWYNMDVTWDDLGENGAYYKYFLKGNNEFPSHFPQKEYKKMAGMVSATSYMLQNEADNGAESSNQDLDAPEMLEFMNSIIAMIGMCAVLSLVVITFLKTLGRSGSE